MWSFKIQIYSGGYDEEKQTWLWLFFMQKHWLTLYTDLGENTIRKMYDMTT